MTITPETGQAIVDHELYWWHRSTLQELDRIAEGWQEPCCASQVGYATKSPTFDAQRHLEQLATAGMAVKVDGHPTHPDQKFAQSVDWFTLTDMGRDWARS